MLPEEVGVCKPFFEDPPNQRQQQKGVRTWADEMMLVCDLCCLAPAWIDDHELSAATSDCAQPFRRVGQVQQCALADHRISAQDQ